MSLLILCFFVQVIISFSAVGSTGDGLPELTLGEKNICVTCCSPKVTRGDEFESCISVAEGAEKNVFVFSKSDQCFKDVLSVEVRKDVFFGDTTSPFVLFELLTDGQRVCSTLTSCKNLDFYDAICLGDKRFSFETEEKRAVCEYSLLSRVRGTLPIFSSGKHCLEIYFPNKESAAMVLSVDICNLRSVYFQTRFALRKSGCIELVEERRAQPKIVPLMGVTFSVLEQKREDFISTQNEGGMCSAVWSMRNAARKIELSAPQKVVWDKSVQTLLSGRMTKEPGDQVEFSLLGFVSADNESHIIMLRCQQNPFDKDLIVFEKDSVETEAEARCDVLLKDGVLCGGVECSISSDLGGMVDARADQDGVTFFYLSPLCSIGWW